MKEPSSGNGGGFFFARGEDHRRGAGDAEEEKSFTAKTAEGAKEKKSLTAKDAGDANGKLANPSAKEDAKTTPSKGMATPRL